MTSIRRDPALDSLLKQRQPQQPQQQAPNFAQLQAQGQARPPQMAGPTPGLRPVNPRANAGGGYSPEWHRGVEQLQSNGVIPFNTGQIRPPGGSQQPPQRSGGMGMGSSMAQHIAQIWGGKPLQGQTPSWVDPRAAAANPEGYAQWKQGYDQRQQPQMAGPTPGGPGQMPQKNGHPDLQQAWQGLFTGVQPGRFGGTPQANFSPGNYQGPGQFDAYNPSQFQLPQVQQQGQFQAPQAGQQVDQRTQQSIMQALRNPSRYGGNEAGSAFDVLNRRLTQQGDVDRQRIDEDMARRGIHASTTAGGRLGDLATNLNQQRADYATNIAVDQARNFQNDRSSAIAQALGFGGQQFQQGLAGFGANQAAGQQRFGQEMDRGQFGLAQNAQNFGQQAQQYGLNQGEAMNRYNAGLNNAQFGLAQQGQNYNQAADRFGLNQQANQQGFIQQLAGLTGLQNFGQQSWQNQMDTAGFNADQDWRNTQLYLQMLGMT